ncbi:hypothetical protein C8Q80DRAFT_1267410 [Daedaleopsis nitida]|nr:hypothetical protein C8Q80DRAFT_1267410 [Daedaleopsis nitida]
MEGDEKGVYEGGDWELEVGEAEYGPFARPWLDECKVARSGTDLSPLTAPLIGDLLFLLPPPPARPPPPSSSTFAGAATSQLRHNQPSYSSSPQLSVAVPVRVARSPASPFIHLRTVAKTGSNRPVGSTAVVLTPSPAPSSPTHIIAHTGIRHVHPSNSGSALTLLAPVSGPSPYDIVWQDTSQFASLACGCPYSVLSTFCNFSAFVLLILSATSAPTELLPIPHSVYLTLAPVPQPLSPASIVDSCVTTLRSFPQIILDPSVLLPTPRALPRLPTHRAYRHNS